MESLETRQKATSLAKQLLDSLGSAEATDVMSRWIVHYIAEQMAVAEAAKGAEKSAAEDRCFNSILSLWKHRTSLPNGQRPFEHFEPILQVLQQLDPDQPSGFYYGSFAGVPQSEPESVKTIVDFIVSIDRTVRMLIELALVDAIAKATNEKTKAILREAIAPGRDIEAIGKLIDVNDRFDANGKDQVRKLIKRIRDRRDKLDEFTRICKAVRAGCDKELRRLEEAVKSSRKPKCSVESV